MHHLIAVLPEFTFACLVLAIAEIRRRMERTLGAILVALGLELAATSR
jgi:hypothetical protein